MATLATLAFTALTGLLVAAILAACGPGASPSPTPHATLAPTARPTPTPIAAPVATVEEAAALVIATNPLFEGAMQLRADVIGASKWWTATPLAAGGFSVELTIGWGDCPAGCINRHVWSFEVSPDGLVRLVSDTGDAVPASLPD